MCTAIALVLSELPVELVEARGLSARVHERGGEKEVRFDWRANPNFLPVWWDGRLQLVRWGNKDRTERKLPPTGWTWKETVEAGLWSSLEPEPVEVPATYALANGVWFRVKRGVQGLVVRTRNGARRVPDVRAGDPLLPRDDPLRVDAGAHRRGHLTL